jgi:LacI family transcriptional regulator
MKRPTQVDVAKLAGVSRATVSLVVNGLADGKVPISEETRLRVLKAVEELGYEPDVRAQTLRTGGTRTIGMIAIDMFNPHHWEFAEGVEQEARERGYNVLLFTRSLDPQYIQRMMKDLMGRRLDGLILSGRLIEASEDARNTIPRIQRHRLPVVEVNDQPPEYTLDCIIADYRKATEEAMAYLISLGHRRIGMVYGVVEQSLGVDRLEPYRETLHHASLPVDEKLIVYCGPTVDDGYQAALRLLKLPQRPTAIVAINDLLAIGVLRAAGDQGLRVPQDLSLIGFDNISLANYLNPRLTTATKNILQIGRDAVRMVLERIEDPEKPYQQIYIPARLIIRESTGPAPS